VIRDDCQVRSETGGGGRGRGQGTCEGVVALLGWRDGGGGKGLGRGKTGDWGLLFVVGKTGKGVKEGGATLCGRLVERERGYAHGRVSVGEPGVEVSHL
jgi:hypothetical protein